MKKIQKTTTTLILLNCKLCITLVPGFDILSCQQPLPISVATPTCTQELKTYIRSTLHCPANAGFFPTVHVGSNMPEEGQILKSTEIVICHPAMWKVICQHKDGLIQCTVDS